MKNLPENQSYAITIKASYMHPCKWILVLLQFNFFSSTNIDVNTQIRRHKMPRKDTKWLRNAPYHYIYAILAMMPRHCIKILRHLWEAMGLTTATCFYPFHGKQRSPIWQLCRYWWHRKLSLRQICQIEGLLLVSVALSMYSWLACPLLSCRNLMISLL